MPVRSTNLQSSTTPVRSATLPGIAPSSQPNTAPPGSTGWKPGGSNAQSPSTGDGFAPTSTTPLKGSGGPADGIEYMKTSGGVQVLSQREAGDFYCEHTCWVLNAEANKAGSSIVKNAEGHALVGFLHLPGVLDAPGPDRHRATTEVIGAAFRGDIDAVRAQGPKTNPVKVLFTGYGAFQGVDNNPTGDFAANPKNIDAAMRTAYGDRLIGPGKNVSTPGGTARQFEVKDASGKTFKVQILAKKLEVDDTAIDGGRGSLQHLLAKFKPQAALSMGVDPGASTYEVVTRSDHGGMVDVNGKLKHDDGTMKWGQEGDDRVQVNDALGKAIAAGNASRPGTVRS